jgi:hypothetical protein
VGDIEGEGPVTQSLTYRTIGSMRREATQPLLRERLAGAAVSLVAPANTNAAHTSHDRVGTGSSSLSFFGECVLPKMSRAGCEPFHVALKNRAPAMNPGPGSIIVAGSNHTCSDSPWLGGAVGAEDQVPGRSRRACASMVSVAVGCASSLRRPIGSPVSSQ